MIITIDGPAGAGKSTIAKALAQALGLAYLDTGAIYRAVALAAQRQGINWLDEPLVAKVARSLATERALWFARCADGSQRVLLEGEDVTEAIRTTEISHGASVVSAHSRVREELLSMQRALGSHGVVAEGRDMGTVVFPTARVKFFLTATAEERARRRNLELLARGVVTNEQATLREMDARDRRDSTRAAAPLRPATDAIDIDTTGLSIEQVLAWLVAEVRHRISP